jgi:hypothetical protein
MAATAMRSGLPVVVWDRRAGASAGLAAQGAEQAASVPDAVETADVVITMVTNAEAVESIATDQGLLKALPSGAVWAQMSTIGAEGTERLVALANDQRPDVYFVDAPVSGSKVPAEQGKLLIFASGPDDARTRVVPVFDAIGQRTLWLGPAGLGSRMKLVNNVRHSGPRPRSRRCNGGHSSTFRLNSHTGPAGPCHPGAPPGGREPVGHGAPGPPPGNGDRLRQACCARWNCGELGSSPLKLKLMPPPCELGSG